METCSISLVGGVTCSVSARDVTGSCVADSGSTGLVSRAVGSVSVGLVAVVLLLLWGLSTVFATVFGVLFVVLSIISSGEGVVAQALKPSRSSSVTG